MALRALIEPSGLFGVGGQGDVLVGVNGSVVTGQRFQDVTHRLMSHKGFLVYSHLRFIREEVRRPPS
jgi:hypothetical protein